MHIGGIPRLGAKQDSGQPREVRGWQAACRSGQVLPALRRPTGRPAPCPLPTSPPHPPNQALCPVPLTDGPILQALWQHHRVPLAGPLEHLEPLVHHCQPVGELPHHRDGHQPLPQQLVAQVPAAQPVRPGGCGTGRQRAAESLDNACAQQEPAHSPGAAGGPATDQAAKWSGRCRMPQEQHSAGSGGGAAGTRLPPQAHFLTSQFPNRGPSPHTATCSPHCGSGKGQEVEDTIGRQRSVQTRRPTVVQCAIWIAYKGDSVAESAYLREVGRPEVHQQLAVAV